MRATSGTGSEVARMSKEQMRQEKLYQATMSMVRKTVSYTHLDVYKRQGFYQYSAAWDSKHKVTLPEGKTARVLFEMQEMQDGGALL